MRENWKFDVAHARPLAAVEARDIELAERLARKPTPHPPLLLYGVVLFCFGIAAYLFGVLLVFPRYLLDMNRWLEPVSQAIVWYSGVPIVAGDRPSAHRSPAVPRSQAPRCAGAIPAARRPGRHGRAHRLQ